MKYSRSKIFLFQLFLQIVGIVLVSTISINPLNQALICGTALCIIGIPHGANDYLFRSDKSTLGLIKFLIRYVGIIILYSAAWLLVPLFALAIFFLISFHHFGQSNFENQSVWYLPSLLWGIWTLLFPVLLHFDEAVMIFQSMISPNASEVHLVSNSGAFELWQFVVAGIFALGYLVSLFVYENKSKLSYIVQFVLVTVWYSSTPLLFGFILMFCLWHSTQSLQHQAYYFKVAFTKSTQNFFLSMIPFSLLALVLFWLYVFFFDYNISLLFVLLSLISLPHVLVMHQLYKGGVEYA